MPKVETDVPEMVRPYEFHGWTDFTVKGEEAHGDCPFCGRPKFSVNLTNGIAGCWGCPVLGGETEKGGVNPRSFLRLLHKVSDAATKDYADLSIERGLLYPETLMHWGVVRSQLDNRWLVPGFTYSGDLWQLYSWRRSQDKHGNWKSKLFPTPGQGHGLHGADLFNKECETVYICEGPSDGWALWEVMRVSGLNDDGHLHPVTANSDRSLLKKASVLAIPGINNWHDKWTCLLEGKKVVICFDSDHPSEREVNGKVIKSPPSGWTWAEALTRKIAASETNVVSIDVITWGSEGYHPALADGYDVRDALRSKGDDLPSRISALVELLALIQPVPEDWIQGKAKAIIKGKQPDLRLRPKHCDNYITLTNAWKKALRWRRELDDVLSVLLAVAVSTEQQGDQLMMQVIGPPGCLHGSTPIFDPIDDSVKTVQERYVEGKEFNVCSLDNNGDLVVGNAMPPWRGEETDLFTVSFASGKSMVVTSRHQFWTGEAYVSLASISEHLLRSGPFPLPTILDNDPSNQLQDARRCSETAGDSRSGCPIYSRSCDESLHAEEGISLDDSPLLDGVPRHIPHDLPSSLLRKDVPDIEYERTLLPSSYHLSKQDYIFPSGPQIADVQQPHLMRGNFSLFSCSFSSLSQDSLRTFPRRRVSDTNLRALDPISSCGLLGESEKIGPPGCTGYDLIVKVEFHSSDVYYDFEVEDWHNYLTNGFIHHNSAKSTISDALLVSPKCHMMEHITGFISGCKDDSGEDFSAISRINRKTLVTSEGDVLATNPAFPQIMSQIRRIFDGKTTATYKNQKEDRQYYGLRTPWIIAATPKFLENNQSSLGDRFLRVWISSPEPEERSAIQQRAGFTELRAVMVTSDGTPESQMEPRLAEAYMLTGGYVDYLRERSQQLLQNIRITDQQALIEYCEQLGEFVAAYRARPAKDVDREHESTKEMATRLTKQFVRLSVCLAAVIQAPTITPDVMRRMRKVAVDTARGKTLDIAEILYPAAAMGLPVKSITDTIGITEPRTRALLRFMREIGLAEYINEKGIRWRLRRHVREIYKEIVKHA